jgi:predicted amidohydrolase YtcJ
MITIYRTRRILTMNPSRPEATHVAVKDGRILGASSLEELTGWGAHALDERFADKVLMPGSCAARARAARMAPWRSI